MNNKVLLGGLGLLSGAVALSDTIIKKKIEDDVDFGEKINIVGDVTVQKHHNKGLPLNAFDKHQKEVAAISASALAIEMIYAGSTVLERGNLLNTLGHGLVIGGALSNTMDRVIRRYVVDYLSFSKKSAIYNLSDLCIILGTVIITLSEVPKQ